MEGTIPFIYGVISVRFMFYFHSLLTVKKKDFFYLVKQFVLTNCSKERPGSVVTETLRNGIFITIVTSKELNFNADFKYISLINFRHTHQKLKA